MSYLQGVLSRLSLEHMRALEWFVEHEGEVGPRPWRRDGRSIIPGVQIPVVAQRGIHQPHGWNVALSITATTNSVYLDGKPIRIDRETWALPYKAHGGHDGAGLGSQWNRALFRNKIESVPVGVFVPEARTYRNLGLAMVESYDSQSDTFLLRGPLHYSQSDDVWASPLQPEDAMADSLLAADGTHDQRVLRRVRERLDQDSFRAGLLAAYEGRCAVTGYDSEAALQGAHILAYRGRSSQQVKNGLLLRADIHLLYDRHLLSVDPAQLRVWVAPQLKRSAYGELDGIRLRVLPNEQRDRPASEHLTVHWSVFERVAGL